MSIVSVCNCNYLHSNAVVVTPGRTFATTSYKENTSYNHWERVKEERWADTVGLVNPKVLTQWLSITRR